MAAGSTRRRYGKTKAKAMKQVDDGTFVKNERELESSKKLVQKFIKELNISNKTLSESVNQLTIQIKKNENIIRKASEFLGKEQMNYDKFIAEAKEHGLLQTATMTVYRRMNCTDIRSFVPMRDVPALKKLARKHKADAFTCNESDRGKNIGVLRIAFDKYHLED